MKSNQAQRLQRAPWSSLSAYSHACVNQLTYNVAIRRYSLMLVEETVQISKVAPKSPTARPANPACRENVPCVYKAGEGVAGVAHGRHYPMRRARPSVVLCVQCGRPHTGSRYSTTVKLKQSILYSNTVPVPPRMPLARLPESGSAT